MSDSNAPEKQINPVERIRLAQDFFRFAYLVGSPISFGLPVDLPEPPEIMTWSKHSLNAEDLRLEPDTFAFCGTILERLAYRLLAMELDVALSQAFAHQDRLNHPDPFVRDASVVIRVIRNAVAHNVFSPVWKVDRKLRNKVIEINDVLSFDTTNLHGTTLRRFDFSGPIALLRLSELVVAYLVQAQSSVAAPEGK